MALTTTKQISPSIYLIADHLDTILAHGEDLIRLPLPPEPDGDISKDIVAMQACLARQRAYLEEVRRLETRLVHRVLRAREHAEHVRRLDHRFKAISELFIGGTHAVADAAADLADSTALDFNTGRDSMAYLRSRGMMAATATMLPRSPELRITDNFRLAGVIELGALLDLASAYVDALELHYELYGVEPSMTAAIAPERAGEAPLGP